MEDGAEAVGNEDGHVLARAGQLPHGLADFLFGEGVEGRRGFVEHHERGFAEQGAGDAEALLFAARYLHAAFADDGIQALGRAGQQRGGRRLVQSAQAFFVGGIGRHEAQVFADGAGEQLRVLGHEPDLLTQLVQVDFGAGDAVVENLAGQGRVEAHQQLHQRGFAGARGTHEGDGFAQLGGEGDAVQRRGIGGEVLEADVFEGQVFDVSHRLGVGRLLVLGRVENLLEVAERNFGFAVDTDDVAQLLQRPEDGKRVNEEREKLAQTDVVLHPQVQQQQDDDVAQQVHKGALHKGEGAQVAHFAQLQFQNFVGGGVQALGFLLGQAQAFDEFDVAQALGGGAGQGRGFGHDGLLDDLDALAQHKAQDAQQRDGEEVARRNGPVHRDGVPHHEDDAHQRRKQHVHEALNELFHVDAHLLELAQGFAGALVLKYLVGQLQGVAQAVGIHLGPQPLGDDVDVVVLEVFGDARHHGHAQHHADVGDGLPEKWPERHQHQAAQVAVFGHELVDQLAKNIGVQQREHLVDGGQHQGQGQQSPVVAQVAVKDFHGTK